MMPQLPRTSLPDQVFRRLVAGASGVFRLEHRDAGAATHAAAAAALFASYPLWLGWRHGRR